MVKVFSTIKMVIVTKGDFRSGNMEGEGVYRFVNGNIYDGEWKNDKSHGQGKYIFKNGDSYIGDFSKWRGRW